jgi:purine-binding chemotaxis protein CheW
VPLEENVSNSGSFAPGQSGPGDQGGQSASANALRDALRALGPSGGRGGTLGTLSAQQLAELAQRAGLPGGMADLARVTGLDLAGTGVAPVAATGPQYVVFAIGELECCVPAEAVQMVERLTDVTPVPNTVGWVRGGVQLRGSIVSVVDLAAYLGLSGTTPSSRTRLLVITQRGMTIGFVVDAVLEMRADSSGMQIAEGLRPPDWLAPYCAQVFALTERRIALVDVQRLLFAEKMHHYRSDVA